MTAAARTPALSTTTRAYVWGGHASKGFVGLLLILHALVLCWLCGGWTRLRLLAFDFREVQSEAVMTLPPPALRAFGYTEDSPEELVAFRETARHVVAGAQSDGERMRQIGDYVYGLRREVAPAAEETDLRVGALTTFAKLRSGEPGSCGEMAMIMAAMWRSLGGDSRTVVWGTVEGVLGHTSLELYSTAARRWMYYDLNVNGYWAEDDGTPLSLSSVRSNVLTGEDLNLVSTANPRFQDWTPGEFTAFLREYPIEWYRLNNSWLYMERDRRFGRFNALYPVLARLPYVDRIADNLTGSRDRRLVVDGKIQIGNLLTFDGARLLFWYCLSVVLICAATLLYSRRSDR